MESEAIGTAASHADFSLFSLIMAADPVVKLVLLFLLLASIWSWMVIGEKLFSLGGLRKKSRQFEEAFWSGRTEDFDMRPGQATNDAASRVFAAAAREWSDARRQSHNPAEAAAIVSRAERSMRAAVDRELGRAGSGLGVLATIGSASPFIGLFGTVWGIMNAFGDIDTTKPILETVTPHIAEALVATAIGLLAAIPAVMAYNWLLGRIRTLQVSLDDFATDYLNIIRRHFFS